MTSRVECLQQVLMGQVCSKCPRNTNHLFRTVVAASLEMIAFEPKSNISILNTMKIAGSVPKSPTHVWNPYRRGRKDLLDQFDKF